MVILGAGSISFVNIQTLITQLLSYFRVIANPKAVFLTTESIKENSTLDEEAQTRLKEMVDGTLEMAFKLQK